MQLNQSQHAACASIALFTEIFSPGPLRPVARYLPIYRLQTRGHLLQAYRRTRRLFSHWRCLRWLHHWLARNLTPGEGRVKSLGGLAQDTCPQSNFRTGK